MTSPRFEVIKELSKKIVLSQDPDSSPDCACAELDQIIANLQRTLFASKNGDEHIPDHSQSESINETHHISLIGQQTTQKGEIIANKNHSSDSLESATVSVAPLAIKPFRNTQDQLAPQPRATRTHNEPNENWLRANIIKGLGIACLLGLVAYMTGKTSDFSLPGADLIDESRPLNSTLNSAQKGRPIYFPGESPTDLNQLPIKPVQWYQESPAGIAVLSLPASIQQFTDWAMAAERQRFEFDYKSNGWVPKVQANFNFDTKINRLLA